MVSREKFSPEKENTWVGLAVSVLEAAHKGKVVSQRDGQTVPASFVIGPKRNCSPASAAILPATLPIPNRPPYAFSEPEVINREIISFGSHYVGFINGRKEREKERVGERESSGSLAREAVSFFASSTFRRLRPDRVPVTTSILMTALWAPSSGNVSVIFPGVEKNLQFDRWFFRVD